LAFHRAQEIVLTFAQYIDVVVVIFVFLLVFVFEYDLFFGVIDGRLEDLVRPLVLSAPVVVFIPILEVVIADIRVTIGDAYVDSFVF